MFVYASGDEDIKCVRVCWKNVFGTMKRIYFDHPETKHWP